MPRWPSAADGLRRAPDEELAEQVAEADAGARHAEAGETSAEVLRSYGIHGSSP